MALQYNVLKYLHQKERRGQFFIFFGKDVEKLEPYLVLFFIIKVLLIYNLMKFSHEQHGNYSQIS